MKKLCLIAAILMEVSVAADAQITRKYESEVYTISKRELLELVSRRIDEEILKLPLKEFEPEIQLEYKEAAVTLAKRMGQKKARFFYERKKPTLADYNAMVELAETKKKEWRSVKGNKSLYEIRIQQRIFRIDVDRDDSVITELKQTKGNLEVLSFIGFTSNESRPSRNAFPPTMVWPEN